MEISNKFTAFRKSPWFTTAELSLKAVATDSECLLGKGRL